MRSRFIVRCIAVAAICFGAAFNGTADGGTFTGGCAARDMQIMIMLEGSDISATERNDAVHAMIDARMMCFEGSAGDALALYDRIAQRLALGWHGQSD